MLKTYKDRIALREKQEARVEAIREEMKTADKEALAKLRDEKATPGNRSYRQNPVFYDPPPGKVLFFTQKFSICTLQSAFFVIE